ncbi:MAG: imidazoleglycerol-phosphate dehydratase, partial [Planctomycetes bacterium]|nr:imidazoleglycerol-phosphate dehydratase [Planctomycetota bacterium]
MSQGKRQAKKIRKTSETEIAVTLGLDGKGSAKVKTGIPFFDHMLNLFARHGLFDLEVKAKGDLDVDLHHTV